MEKSIAVQQPWHEFLGDLPLSETERLDYLGWLLGLPPGTLKTPDAVLPGERSSIRARHSAQKVEEWREAQMQAATDTVAELLGLLVCTDCGALGEHSICPTCLEQRR